MTVPRRVFLGPAAWLPRGQFVVVPVVPAHELPDETLARSALVGVLAGRPIAYANVCRHLAVPLDFGDGDVMDPDSADLLCRHHGAVFAPDTGQCTLGPCQGESLWQFKIEVDAAGDAYLVLPAEPLGFVSARSALPLFFGFRVQGAAPRDCSVMLFERFFVEASPVWNRVLGWSRAMRNKAGARWFWAWCCFFAASVACTGSKLDGGRPVDLGKGAGRAKSVHLSLGIPTDRDPSDDLLLIKPQYALSYNPRRGGPNWVSWNLNAEHFGAVKRYRGKFLADESLPAGVYRVRHEDYVDSGYDRGHMVQSEERTATPEDNLATFFMTNVLPQTHELNAGPWLALENECNDLARREGKELFIVAGGIYPPAPETIGHGVALPDAFFKVVVVLERGQGPGDVTTRTRVHAARFPNATTDASKTWASYRVSVRSLEQATGYEFLSDVDAGVQQALESTVASGWLPRPTPVSLSPMYRCDQRLCWFPGTGDASG